MDTKLLEKVTNEYKKVKHPDFRVGDIVEVHTKIKEEKKVRIQVFKGIVLKIKGSGVSKTFTVRKISYGIGVEKVFPYYSDNIEKIKLVKRAEKVRRSKLYYLRKRVGKSALKAGIQIPAEEEDLESKFEEEETAKAEADESKKDEESKEENKDEKKDEKEEKAKEDKK